MSSRKYVKYATAERLERVNKKNIKLYDRYLKARISRNQDTKNSTYKQYQSSIKIFFSFLLEEYDNAYILDEELVEEFPDVMDDYVYFLQNTLMNNKKRINFHLSAISSLFIFCIERRMLQYNPMQNVQRMKNAGDEKLLQEHFLTKEESDKITSELAKTLDEDYDGAYDIVDLMIWTISYDSACRIGGLLGCTVDNLTLGKDGGYFDSVREKGGKVVPIPFTKQTGEYIEKYLEWRESEGVDTDYIIASFNQMERERQVMSRTAVGNRVRKIGEILGLEGFRNHSIRKTRLNQLAEHDILLAQAMGNHEDVSTTQKSYTKKKDANDVMKKIKELGL